MKFIKILIPLLLIIIVLLLFLRYGSTPAKLPQKVELPKSKIAENKFNVYLEKSAVINDVSYIYEDEDCFILLNNTKIPLHLYLADDSLCEENNELIMSAGGRLVYIFTDGNPDIQVKIYDASTGADVILDYLGPSTTLELDKVSDDVFVVKYTFDRETTEIKYDINKLFENFPNNIEFQDRFSQEVKTYSQIK